MATVAQGERPRADSPSVLVRGPPIVPPTSVFLHAEPGRQLRVNWNRNLTTDPALSYKVLFTPDETLGQGCATRYRTYLYLYCCACAQFQAATVMPVFGDFLH